MKPFSSHTFIRLGISISLFVMIGITLYPFWEIGFVTMDDWMYYCYSHYDNTLELTFNYAKNNGRFYFAITYPFYIIPYFFDNHFFTKSIQ